MQYSEYIGQECHVKSSYQDILAKNSQCGRVVAPIPCHQILEVSL